jgi:hypothetical protein
MAGVHEHANEPSGFIKPRFLERTSNNQHIPVIFNQHSFSHNLLIILHTFQELPNDLTVLHPVKFPDYQSNNMLFF